jgi:DNA-binding response OmpR family regulator
MNTTRVLIIEDNPQVVESLKQALVTRRSDETFEITAAGFLYEGINALAGVDKFDVVLLDLDLPDSAGLDSLRRVLAACPTVAVIVLSESTRERLAVPVLRMGADDYLMKRDIPNGLYPRAICYAVERRRVQAQLRRTQQLEVLSQIAGAALHEFNNLIFVVSGNVDLMELSHDSGEGHPRRVQTIQTALRRMAAITNNIMKFTREQKSAQPLPHVQLDAALANIQKLIDQNSFAGSQHV